MNTKAEKEIISKTIIKNGLDHWTIIKRKEPSEYYVVSLKKNERIEKGENGKGKLMRDYISSEELDSLNNEIKSYNLSYPVKFIANWLN